MCKETGGIVVNEIVWHNKHKHPQTHTVRDGTERKLRPGRREGKRERIAKLVQNRKQSVPQLRGRNETSRWGPWVNLVIIDVAQSFETMLIPGNGVTVFSWKWSRLKFQFESSFCKDVCSLWPPTVPLCQSWSVNWSTAMAWDELTFCDGWMEGRVWLRRKLLVNPSCGFLSK